MTALLLALLTAQAPSITINGKALSPREAQVVGALPAGAYWYDPMTGAYGVFGGPTAGFVAAGLGLGGRLPANASGGGNGQLTGVFINGRELHPIDVQQLSAYLRMPLQLGRFWVDAQGNAGPEGGPFLFNLHALAKANGGGAKTKYTNDGNGNSTTVTQGCAAVHQRTGSGDSKVDSSTYVGCE